MPRCPYCRQVISFLEYYAWELVTSNAYIIKINKLRSLSYAKWHTIDIDESAMEYRCPSCRKTIARSPKGAKEFLERVLYPNSSEGC
jgi:predicted RNA-binding Zn-ribbon protein involved in translation (DUF1610 family)